MDTMTLVLLIVASPWALTILFIAICLTVKLVVFPFRSALFPGELNFVQKALDGSTGKRWTAMPCLSDHIVILGSHLTALFGAYTGCCGEAIEHDYVEAVMVAVNSDVGCPYCDGLHTQLADLSGHGTEAANKLLAADSAASATAVVNKPGVAYARQMGELNVRSKGEEEAYATLVTAEGPGRAKSIKALAIFLYWGGMTGNTINCVKKRLIGVAPLKGLTLFSLIFFIWCAPALFRASCPPPTPLPRRAARAVAC